MSGPVPVTVELLRAWPLPQPGSEKHRRGVVLVVAGSATTPGAARLAGEASLRAGAGQLKVATVTSVAGEIGVGVPEARVHGFDEAESGDLETAAAASVAELAEDADAVLVGPGFVDPEGAETFLAELVPSLRTPLVIDALASGYAGHHPDQLAGHAAGCVVTMNPAELAHALGLDTAEVEADPEGAVRRLVDRTGVVVLFGGESKVVGTPGGRCFVVTAGGPGLAVSGSGDVQAGIITGLLARGASADQAAVWGAWLHGSAGDRQASRVGPLGFLAREIADEVPDLLDTLTP